ANHDAGRHHVVEAQLNATVPGRYSAVDGRECGTVCGVDGAAVGVGPAVIDMTADIEAGPIVTRRRGLVDWNCPSELGGHCRNVNRIDWSGEREPDGQRLDRVQDIVHHAILAH